MVAAVTQDWRSHYDRLHSCACNQPVYTPNVGQWFVSHYRTRALESGAFQVAKNLRKQGVPISVALQILAPSHHYAL